MKWLFTISLFLLAATGSARSADLALRPSYPTVPVDWAGVYVGFNAGAAWGQAKWVGVSANTFGVSGATAGPTVGYNFQNGSWVWGLEGDFDWSAISGDSVSCPLNCAASNNWMGTARARFGYSFGRFLPFVSGGLAFGDIKASGTNFTGIDETKLGWVAGGGIDFSFSPNWIGRLEYIHVDLSELRCGPGCNGGAPNTVKFQADNFRAALVFKFGCVEAKPKPKPDPDDPGPRCGSP